MLPILLRGVVASELANMEVQIFQFQEHLIL